MFGVGSVRRNGAILRGLFVLVAFVCAVGSSSCSDDPTGPRYTPAIRGSVTFVEAPFYVSMTAISSAGSHFVEVEDDGTFSASLPPGVFQLELDIRYADLQRIFYVGESEVSYHDDVRGIEIGVREPSKRIDVQLGSVRVHVQAPEEWEGDVVRLLSGDSDAVRATVSNGEALLFDPCVPMGEQQLVLLNPDFPVYYPGTQDPSVATPILVAPEEQTELDLDLSSPARLHCRFEGGAALSLRLQGDDFPLGVYDLGIDPDVSIPLYCEGRIDALLFETSGSIELTEVPGYEDIEVTRGTTTELSTTNWDVVIETDLPDWQDDASARLWFYPVGGSDPIPRILRHYPEPSVGLVPFGSYRIEIEPRSECGRTWLPTWYPYANSEDDALVVDITGDPTSRRLRFDLREAAKIEGHVRYSGGEVGAAGNVFVYSDPDLTPDCGFTLLGGGDGRFVVDGLESGTYWCRFRTRWLGEMIDLWYPGVTSFEDATPLVLAEGEAARDIDFWVGE